VQPLLSFHVFPAPVKAEGMVHSNCPEKDSKRVSYAIEGKEDKGQKRRATTGAKHHKWDSTADRNIMEPSGLPAGSESALSVRAATGVESRIFDEADGERRTIAGWRK
jgi:hypothetical protein